MFGLRGRKEFLRIISFVRPQAARYLIGLAGVSIVGAAASALTAYVIKDLLDAAITGNGSLLTRAVVLIGSMVLGLAVFAPLFSYMFKSSVKRITAEIRLTVFSHIETMQAACFENTHSGDIVSRVTNDIEVMEGALSGQIYELTYTVVSGICSAVLMFIFDWRIALALIILGIASAVLNTCFAGPVRRISDRIQEEFGALTERLSDLLGGFYAIKMFAISDLILRKYDRVNDGIARASMRRNRVEAFQDGANFLLGWLNFGGVMVLGSLMALHGSVSFGRLAATVQLLNGVSAMFLNAGGFMAQLQVSLAGAGRVFELLDEPPETEGFDIPSIPESHNSEIEMQDVVFCYEGEKRVLDGFSLKVEKGRVAALVGLSGSGKSTVFKLLMGFYSPGNGRITIGNKPIEHYSLHELRSLIAYVSQDAYLFEGTIEENIRFGRPDASKDEIIAAAKAANAHDFILEQPDGYESLTGERGVLLSGGQRQRIAIARAILKNAPILLLDEATSALDSESEQLVQEAINTLMKDRTAIVAAHRLSTIEHADVIYVINTGRVVEKGTHSRLAVDSRLYRRLYELQYGDYTAAGTG
jgi:ATP-binding cassette subfamily B protein